MPSQLKGLSNLWMAKVAAGIVGGGLILTVAWQVAGAPGVADWLNRWQTLITGFLAIVAALIGGGFIYWQTQDQIYRKRQASRAVLSLSLSEICGYAEKSGRLGRRLWDECEGQALPESVVVTGDDIPILSSDIIDDLRSMIEYVEREEIQSIARLIRELQIFKGRMSDLASPRRRRTLQINIEEHILDAAEIYARSEALFEFSRREVDHVPQDVRWQRIHAALFFMDIFAGMMPSLDETIARRSSGDPSNFIP